MWESTGAPALPHDYGQATPLGAGVFRKQPRVAAIPPFAFSRSATPVGATPVRLLILVLALRCVCCRVICHCAAPGGLLCSVWVVRIAMVVPLCSAGGCSYKPNPDVVLLVSAAALWVRQQPNYGVAYRQLDRGVAMDVGVHTSPRRRTRFWTTTTRHSGVLLCRRC